MPRPTPDQPRHSGPRQGQTRRGRKSCSSSGSRRPLSDSLQRLRGLRSAGPGVRQRLSGFFTSEAVPLALELYTDSSFKWKKKKRNKLTVSGVPHSTGKKNKLNPETPTPLPPLSFSVSPAKLWPRSGSLSLLLAAVPGHTGSLQEPDVSRAELNQCSLCREGEKKKKQQNCPRDRSDGSFVQPLPKTLHI